MSSEAIVVLVLIGIAIGFVIWVRMNSHDHDPGAHAGNNDREAREARDPKHRRRTSQVQ